jgi:hypothetical protein
LRADPAYAISRYHMDVFGPRCIHIDVRKRPTPLRDST